MAAKLDVATKRSETLKINPADIVIPADAFRGRMFAPTEEAVVALAQRILNEGQLQPVGIVKNADKKPQLVYGFTRHAAALWICEHKDPAFLLDCKLVIANPEKQIELTISENRGRTELSDMDHAYNQQILRERRGMGRKEIAQFYGCTETQVDTYKTLLELPEATQRLIHEKKLPTYMAVDLVDLTPDQQAKIIADATVTQKNGTVKIKGTEIMKGLREIIGNIDESEEMDDTVSFDSNVPVASALNGEETETATDSDSGNSTAAPTPRAPRAPRGRRIHRTLSEMRKYFQKKVDQNRDVAEVEFCRRMLLWMNGQRNDKSMDKFLAEFLDASRTEPEARDDGE